TPNGIQREPTGANAGQWGMSHDDDGKMWFVDAGGERGPVNFQFPVHYGAFSPCTGAGGGTRRGGRGGRGASGAPGATGAAPGAQSPAAPVPPLAPAPVDPN